MQNTTQTAAETMALAKSLLEQYPEHKIWLLYGNLGAGKTTLVKGLAEALGIEASAIKSPTFTLISEHPGLIHYDLYRLEKLDPFTLDQLEEHLAQGKHLVIEWPEKIEAQLQRPHLRIHLEHKGGDEREITVTEVP
ncbi:MAG: tRNA (adenosine(37)-N6)-threonylcarbamoyltransferase complex ATPase subunit type 1 TsaE [Candidatus Gracilibacteria bacterium]|jgi:tRNA threonylcarbamoyladenosine biosynthesis protein TsaE